MGDAAFTEMLGQLSVAPSLVDYVDTANPTATVQFVNLVANTLSNQPTSAEGIKYVTYLIKIKYEGNV